MDMKSKIWAICFALLFCVVSGYWGYNKGASDTNEELTFLIEVRKKEGYKEGQLDALNGKQIYEVASFEDGTRVVMERNEVDEHI
jgi:hypothetical protein